MKTSLTGQARLHLPRETAVSGVRGRRGRGDACEATSARAQPESGLAQLPLAPETSLR